MKTDEQIRAHVMRRVYTMYWARQLKKPATRFAFVGALSAGLLSSVSIVNVALNALAVGSIEHIAAFFLAAFVGTTLAVQAMLVALVGSIGWFAFDALKKVREVVMPVGEAATAQ